MDEIFGGEPPSFVKPSQLDQEAAGGATWRMVRFASQSTPEKGDEERRICSSSVCRRSLWIYVVKGVAAARGKRRVAFGVGRFERRKS